MKSSEEMKALHGSNYVDNFLTLDFSRRIGRIVELMDIAHDAHVVDFGCGDGQFMEHVAPTAASYTGVDFSEEFISRAEARRQRASLDNVRLCCTDIHEFCQQHRTSFHSALAMDISEHVYDDEWLRILRSIRSSLVPGGKLFLHTPNRDYLLERMKEHNFLIRQTPQHVAVRNPEENIRLLSEAGFGRFKVTMLPHYNVLRFLHFLSFIPAIGRCFKARIFIEAIN